MISQISLSKIWCKVVEYRWQLLLLFVTILLPLWVFGELADEVVEQEHLWFDDRILLFLYAYSTPLFNTFMLLMSQLGYLLGVVPVSIGIFILLIHRRRRYDAVFFAIAVLGSALLNAFAKHHFGRERPTLWQSIAPETSLSFPSGHAMGTMALATAVIVLVWSTKWRYPAIVLGAAVTFLVCLSRVYLGVHYPSDILAGVAASLAWVTGLSCIFYRRIGRPR